MRGGIFVTAPATTAATSSRPWARAYNDLRASQSSRAPATFVSDANVISGLARKEPEFKMAFFAKRLRRSRGVDLPAKRAAHLPHRDANITWESRCLK